MSPVSPVSPKTKELERRDTTEPTGEPDIPILTFVEEPEPPETFNVMLYGPPKSGKSTAAATAPGPILWLNAQGEAALAYPRKVARERGTRIMEVRVDRGDDMREALRNVLRFVKKTEGPDAPKTVVVDTIANVRERLASRIVVEGARNSMQQWREVTKIVREFVYALRDAPVNFVVIAHQEVADADGDRIVRPLVGGVLTEEIPAEVDIIAFTYSWHDQETDERRWLGQLAEGKGRVAGDRSGGGLGGQRDLDLTEWLHVYRKALGASELPWSDEYERKPGKSGKSGKLHPDDEALSAELPELPEI